MADYDDDETYDPEEGIEEDELLDGEEDLGSLDPALDTIYNWEVVSCKLKTFEPREGEEVGGRVINATLTISDGEFEGERIRQDWWIGPKGIAKEARFKFARKDFNKFFEACTGESIGKGSTANPRETVGSTISAKLITAEYEKDGEILKAGQVKIQPGTWSTPIEVESYYGDEDEDPV